MPRPGGRGRAVEKPKNFKNAITRLFRELGNFRKFVIIGLVVAALSSILTIFTPNILSDLTDEISDGLVLNQDNFTLLTEKVTSVISDGSLIDVLDLDINSSNISIIMSDVTITEDEEDAFNDLLNGDTSVISSLSDTILMHILNDDNGISVQDKIDLIRSLDGNLVISDDIALELFEGFDLDDVYISEVDQAEFLEIVSGMSSDIDSTALYSLIDEMPESIQSVVEPFMDIDEIKSIVIFLLVIYLISALLSYGEAIIMTNVANRFAKRLRSRISEKINKLPLNYFDHHVFGDVLSRVTNDISTIAMTLDNSLSSLISAITLFVGVIIMMIITNPIMAATAVVSSLLGFVFMFVILGKSQKYFVMKQNELGNLEGHIEEIYSGLNVVRTCNGKVSAKEEFDDLNKKLYTANWKSTFLSGLMQPMMSFIGNFGYVAVCIVGALLAINGNITFGVIVAFITYVRLFTSPLSQIAQAFNNLQSTAAASERVFEFLDETEMADESNFVKHLDKDKVKGSIEFKNIEFTYDGNDEPTIKNFSAKAEPGQKIAIVGPTGAGKTTMVNLLMKFYDVSKGDILIDGVSTKELTRENIHQLFTMVLQDTWLFNGTVRENIAYNRDNVSEMDVREVCKTVGLDHFVKTLPNGYDTIISDNDSVSAGQRQLLTIARGMIEDAPFLILDEATSNVDTRTEELVQKAMDKLTEGKTSFIIAHRLSTIKNADLILVMRDGNIVETGNHDELMKKNGFYAELYNSQFEL